MTIPNTRFSTLQRSGFLLPSRMQASYEAASQGRRSKGWQAGSSGPASTGLGGLQTLRNRARAAGRNDPWACAAVDRLVSNTIGTGITPMPMVKDKATRAAINTLWNDWAIEADADERLDYYGLQAMVAREMYESGECFIRLRPRRPKDGLAVPLQLQVLAAEYVPHTKHETAAGGNSIAAGIEFNGIGQRVAYWMYRRHPNDLNVGTYNDLVRVPASNVLHVYEPLRAGQLRGIPIAAPVLARLHNLDNFDDAVLFRQEVANLFAGFLRRPSAEAGQGTDPITGQPIQTDHDGFTPMVGMEPGTMQELLPGEEVQFSDPPTAGDTYPDYMRQQLLAVAAGHGLPYEVLTGDLREVNDRVIRVVLQEFRRRIEQRQHAIFVHQFCRPSRTAFMDMAVLSGALPLNRYDRHRREYLRTRWVPQGWKYIHPLQDVQAQRAAVRAGFKSRDAVILETDGYDPEVVDQEILASGERAAEMGLDFETDPYQPPAGR